MSGYMVKVAQGGAKLLIFGSERHIKTDVLLLVPKIWNRFLHFKESGPFKLAIKHRQMYTKMVRLI
jgi:hypothetical protein